MKHILDYRGYMIFKLSHKEYVVRVDSPDGLLPQGQVYQNLLEAMVAINRGFYQDYSERSPNRFSKFFVDFFNISA